MVPLSVLGKLRHELVRRLDAAIAKPHGLTVALKSPLPTLRERGPATLSDNRQPTTDNYRHASPSDNRQLTTDNHLLTTDNYLEVLCRSLDQLRTVLACGVANVTVDFRDIREYGEAVRLAHAGGAAISIATPRIQKPGEMGIFRVLARHGADGVLVRNLSGLAFFRDRGVPVVADFSLNATNELSVYWLRQQGAARVAASYDMNRDQLLDLVAAVPPDWLEVVVHQHMPMFHMEHCVFLRSALTGDEQDELRPAVRPSRSHVARSPGNQHPLQADVGCRNTLFNATPQSAAEIVPLLQKGGVRHFRIEFLDSSTTEDPSEVLALYADLLAGRISGPEVWRRLKAVNRVGVTRGTLEARRDPLAIL